MHQAQIDRFLGKLLGFTGAFTTIFLISGSVTDPVNVPKLVALGVLGFAAFATVCATQLVRALISFKLPIIVVAVFVTLMILGFFTSQAPVTQVLYGSYGRNNGLLAYVFLSAIFLSTLVLMERKSFQSILNALIVAGVVNLIYCLWVISFGDFISWSNPYGNILGTLGNPNFIGAFLGIIFSTLVAISLNQGSSRLGRVLSLCGLPLCAFEIIKSHAIQGRVVAAFGSAVVLFLFIRAKFNKIVLFGYSLLSIILGALALAGALQIGPLAKFIYKTSVSLRGQYWLAGWNTGQEHPITGVGMDAFGDWYRRMRDPHALELPGVNTVVNAAHNVPIDIFAFGGWPLFVSYLFIMGIAGFSIFRMIQRSKSYDLILVVFAAAWAGYQLQSVISINQIGLAVWGWLLSGAVIAYERFTRNSDVENTETEITGKKNKAKSKSSIPAQVPLYATVGGLVGLLIALPPLIADAKWRSSQVARTVPALQGAMTSSYFNPPNSMKYLTTVQALEGSQLFDLAHKYALEAVKWNPDAFELWKVLYLIKNSTPVEKDEALRNMKRLDPLNPDVTSTQ
jgi:O-Antigen ligase